MSNNDAAGSAKTDTQDKDHWVGFKVVDEETGTPLDGINVLIKCSKGAEHQIKTDADGKVKFEQMPEGSCDVVRLFKKNTIMEEKEEYTLKDNDTLPLIRDKEVAAGNDITWDNIASFNWGENCRDKRIANEYMRDMCGCTHYTSTGEMVYKSASGATAKIKIPKDLVRPGLPIDTEHEIRVRVIENPEQFKACCGIPYITFESKKSFIAPNAKKNLEKLKEALEAHPKENVKAMLFGHTDLLREDEENKVISERRAKSTFSFITKDPDYWVTLYKKGKEDDNEDWGAKTIQIILNYLNPEAELDLSNYYDKRTREEINKSFSISSDENIDITDSTLKDIFQKYMDKMLEGIDLAESDFMPLKHAGCGAFNPVYNIEKSEEENRRVTFFLFDKDNLPKLPCSNTDIEPCKKQIFQKDNDKGAYRNYKEFRCCYYDSLAKDCKGEITVPDIIAYDAHMHFMSGCCTPLPLLWNQLPFKPKLRRTNLDFIGKYILRIIPTQGGNSQGARMQEKTTLKIADTGFNYNHEVYEKIYQGYKEKSSKRELLTPLMAMPMDMVYAHIDGYKGQPIYQKIIKRSYFYREEHDENGSTILVKTLLWPDDICEDTSAVLTISNAKKVYGEAEVNRSFADEEYDSKKGNEGYYYYRERFSVFDADQMAEMKRNGIKVLPPEKKFPVWLKDQEMDLFEDWEAQKEATIAIAVKYPFQYMAMYHYEPRRWSLKENRNNKNMPYFPKPRNWDEPFKEVATVNNAGVFVGFKMYTALGYKPYDQKLKKTLKEFYKKCEKENIPIMCHCSPSGMWSHDRELYFDSEKSSFKNLYKYEKRNWYGLGHYDEYNRAIGYYDEFVRPTAWETQVLRKFPDLKLCLAHFGGGSSDWTTWLKDTRHKMTELKKIKRKKIGNSNVVITPEEEEVLIASWYNRFEPKENRKYKGNTVLPGWYYDCFGKEEKKENEKNKRGNPNPQTWIKDFVEIMGMENGKKYKNFYTDISFHFIKDHNKQFLWVLREFPFIKDRVMFGTDWYMTELDKKTIKDFTRDAHPAINGISESLKKSTGISEDLWVLFTRINPMKFYNIRSIVDKYAEGLEDAAIKYKEELKDDYDGLKLKNTKLNKHLGIIKKSDFV